MTLDEQLIQSDIRAREHALDVSRSFIVQAPAGSGKTELLIQRYLKLLAVVDHPEEVLAITFTRKAAAEMQLRVIDALRKALQNDVSSEPHEMITAEAAGKVLERDRQFEWNIVANPRRLRIQTLDSLNAAIARTQPLTSTSGAAGNTIIADAEMRALYQNAAALTFDQLTEADAFQVAAEQVLLHVDNNTALYIEYLARMLATRDQWLPFVGSGLIEASDSRRLRKRFEQSLGRLARVFPESMAAELLKLAAYASENLRESGQADDPVCCLGRGSGWPGTDAGDLPEWLGIAELLLTRQGTWRKQVNKNIGFPPGDGGQKAAMTDLLEALHDHQELGALLDDTRTLPPISYSDEQWQVLLALFRLLPLTVTELKRLFSERGVCDHIEVALSAAAAIGTADEPGDVALLLDYQLRHLLVDEMQDTSSAQYRMLEALTGGWEPDDGRTLFCVGDPMQSIYRFRNAEVGQFLLAQQAGIGNVDLRTLTLRRNFRSGEKLVDWFNDVFPSVLAKHDDPQRSAVAYSAAVAVPKLAGKGACVVHPLFGSDAAAEADHGCRLIGEVLEADTGSDMAVLVRSRTQLPALLSRLRKAGIDYRAVEIDRLTDLPEIIDILALTRALVHHGDRLAWLATLRSPWVGLDWSDLHALVKNDTQSTTWELLNDEERVERLSVEGGDRLRQYRDTLREFVFSGRVRSLRDRVEQAWLALGGPAILDDTHGIQNIYRYLDVIEKLEVAGTLPDAAVLEAALDMEHVSSDVDARLQIMTMHRAKGLQFDHVLLYGLGRVPRPREHGVLNWVELPDEHGGSQKVISPVGPRAELERDPVHRYIGTAESAKDENELGRLLYVACTRARKSLHLLGHARLLKRGISPDRRSLLNLLWPAVATRFEEAYDSADHETTTTADDGWYLPVLKRFKSAWSIPQPKSLPGQPDASVKTEENTPVEFYWVGSAARFAGTVVHRWIQLATEGRVDLNATKMSELRPASERWLREMGVGTEAMPAIVERIEQALSGITGDEKGCWLLRGDGHAELRMSGIVQGSIESVVIDRVRIGGDGTHWVVDYKTSSHEGGSLSSFLEAETDRYRPQLAKYAELYRNYSGARVRCALYFPLLQEFVEVAV
jgi:ATP-dependent exoDNAse (exonuclease V) beta subunit